MLKLSTLSVFTSTLAVAMAAPPPNLVYVLADDHGYHDFGFRNPDIKTPTLDSLAAEGVTLERYFAYRFCSPTRSSLMSGRLPLHVNMANRPLSKKVQ
jgi:arylsulfatase A-like enzyme